MAGDSPTGDAPETDGPTTIEPGADGPITTPAARTSALVAVVVRQDRGPDRCTVYPADAAEATRLTTWVSVNADALCDLAAMR